MYRASRFCIYQKNTQSYRENHNSVIEQRCTQTRTHTHTRQSSHTDIPLHTLYKHTTCLLSPWLWPMVYTACVCFSVSCAVGHVITLTPFNTYTHTLEPLIPDQAFHRPLATHKGSQYEDCIVHQIHTHPQNAHKHTRVRRWLVHGETVRMVICSQAPNLVVRVIILSDSLIVY